MQHPLKTIGFSVLALVLMAALHSPAVAVTLQGQAKQIGQTKPLLRGVTNKLESSASRHQSQNPCAANAVYVKANAYLKDMRLEDAENLYRQLLANDANNVCGHTGLGKVSYFRTTVSDEKLRMRHAELYDDAIQHLLRAIRYAPGFMEPRLVISRVYLTQRRLADAREGLRQALNIEPQHPEANQMVGEVLARQGRYDEAKNWLDHSLDLNGRNAAAYEKLGGVKSSLGDFSGAISALKASIRLDARRAEPYFELGNVYELQGNGAAAIAAWEECLRLSPENRQARIRLANHYEQRGDLIPALTHLQTLLSIYPEDNDVRRHAAKLAEKSGQTSVAQKLYKQFLARDPQNRDVRMAMSQLQVRKAVGFGSGGSLSDIIQSERFAEQAAVYSPDNLQARLIQVRNHRGARSVADFEPGVVQAVLSSTKPGLHENLTRGEVLTTYERYDDARQAFQAALDGTTQPKDLMNLGELFLNVGQPGLAEQAFQRILNREPGNKAARIGLQQVAEIRRDVSDLWQEAEQLRREKSYFEASNRLKNLIRRDVTATDAHLALAQILEQQGHFDDAINRYETYLQLSPAGSDESRQVENRVLRLRKRVATLSMAR